MNSPPCSAGKEEKKEKDEVEEEEAVTWGSTVAGVSVYTMVCLDPDFTIQFLINS